MKSTTQEDNFDEEIDFPTEGDKCPISGEPCDNLLCIETGCIKKANMEGGWNDEDE